MGILQGRRKITSEATFNDLLDVEVLADVINDTMALHLVNKGEIDFLTRYAKGDQPILYKAKDIRSDINNTLVVNHAEMISRTVVGYFLGTPIQYVQNGSSEKQAQIDLLNKYVSYENKPTSDKEIGTYQSICGTGYRIVYTDGEFGDEVPFEEKALDPSTTYVVYENSIAERPLLGITYYDIISDSIVTGIKMFVYTRDGMHVITSYNGLGLVTAEDISPLQQYNIGGVPIIEYPNNIWRIGDWELSMGLMDAVNNLQSGRLDDIDQIVQSLLVFINAEIDTETYDDMIKKGVVLLKNTTQMKSEVQSISNPLDQAGMNLFSQELEQLLYAMIGIPDRNTRGGGGGDTGQAVELRDGWADLEIVARNKELVFKKAEKQTLRIILSILNSKESFDLSLIDVDIKFTRNKNNNLMVKAQSYSTLLATKTLSPLDCLSIVDMVSDPNEYIERGVAFWGEDFGNKVVAEAVESDSNTDSGTVTD